MTPTTPRVRLRTTLSSADYCSPEVFAVDRAQVFHRGWVYVGHVDGLPVGTKRVFDIAGESVLVTRDLGGSVHAFANVCRHRGAQLCDAAMTAATKGSIRCPYHSWTYGLDGELLATPRVDDDFDRAEYGLFGLRADTWNGMVFVSLDRQASESDVSGASDLADWLATTSPYTAQFAELPVASYKIGARTEVVVEANWKIIVENYCECLHCAIIHPELAELIPLYKTGNVVNPDDPGAAVGFADGRAAHTLTGRSELSVLPGLDGTPCYDGVAVFPNLFFDLTPTCLALTAIFPVSATRCVVVGEYLFAAQDAARPDFDPTPEVEMNELIGSQDYVVCELVQRGVASRFFTAGALTAKDAGVAQFIDKYLAARGQITTD